MTTKSKAPAFQFYPEKWLAATMHLSDAAYRAYHLLICAMWIHGVGHCAVPNYTKRLQVLTGLRGRAFTAAWAEIMDPHMPLLRVEGDMLVSNGLRKVAEQQAKRRERGKRGANGRW